MKPVNVAFAGDAAEKWESLNRTVAEENEKGIQNSESQQILKSIKQKIEMIKINPQYGDSVSKKLIPAKLAVDNLWVEEVVLKSLLLV